MCKETIHISILTDLKLLKDYGEKSMEIRRLARNGKRWIIGQNQKSLASSRRRNVQEGMA
jgi:hypothetical protein